MNAVGKNLFVSSLETAVKMIYQNHNKPNIFCALIVIKQEGTKTCELYCISIRLKIVSNLYRAYFGRMHTRSERRAAI